MGRDRLLHVALSSLLPNDGDFVLPVGVHFRGTFLRFIYLIMISPFLTLLLSMCFGEPSIQTYYFCLFVFLFCGSVAVGGGWGT